MDIVFKLQENEFRGVSSLQMMIEDMKVSASDE
jgi:hypothetical protein